MEGPGDTAIGGCDNLAMVKPKGGPQMTVKIDEESKKRIEETNRLQDHVSAIHAEIKRMKTTRKQSTSELVYSPGFPFQIPT